MSYRRRYRLTRTYAAAITAAFVFTVWPAGNASPTISTMYEDGSFERTDGTVGCLPGALCDDSEPTSVVCDDFEGLGVACVDGVTGTDVTSDGRYAPCGVVTEEGVTEFLDEYARRCGR